MKFFILSMVTVFLISNSENLNNRLRNDASLIIPGVGAEKVILNENLESTIGSNGYPDKVSEFEKHRELFNDVFKIKSPVEILFNKIYYYKNKNIILFSDADRITGIAGSGKGRITADSVDLGKGIEYFIFSYGNKELEIIKKENGSSDRIYLYSKYGIALIDDSGDDSIDLYIIFPAVRE